jgi:23S rRNA G2445 N2-methylase RlmL
MPAVFAARPHALALHGPGGGLAEVFAEASAALATPWKPHKFEAQVEQRDRVVLLHHLAWEQAQELAARLATVHDLRLMLAKARIQGWDDLGRVVRRQPWAELLPFDASIDLHADAAPGVCDHAGTVWEVAAEALGRCGLRGADPDVAEGTEPVLRLDVVTWQDQVRLGISLGNGALFKRGWRAHTSTLASLREDVAAVALHRLWGLVPAAASADHVLVPLAGSGTLGLEAWHSLGLPPGVWGKPQPWQWLGNPSPASQAWWPRRIRQAARAVALPALSFIERDERQASELRANIAHASHLLTQVGVAPPAIRAMTSDLFEHGGELLGDHQLTLLPLHPPYGLRLANHSDLARFYDRLGRWVAGLLRTGERQGQAVVGFCLCPTEELWRAFRAGLGHEVATTTSHLSQGGLDVRHCGFWAGPLPQVPGTAYTGYGA